MGPILDATERPLCRTCGERRCRIHRTRVSGVKYKKDCAKCFRSGVRFPRAFLKKGYLRHRKDFCEACGFVALHKAQLEVDHVDGNHSNHAPSNLRTLCANCHRLKTMVERGLYKEVSVHES